MDICLRSLEKNNVASGLYKLGQAGIDADRWLAMLDASPESMQRLVAAWPVHRASFAYDAVALFGFGEASAEPLPEAQPGEVIIRYGGWSLRELCANVVVRKKNLMLEQDWYHTLDWSTEKLPPGIYRLRIPVPCSKREFLTELERSLPGGEKAAPVVLVATALLAHRRQTGEDLLRDGGTRCREVDAHGPRVELFWNEGDRLCVNSRWDGILNPYPWSSSVRISEEP